MKISGGIKENGIVVGNSYDKYGSRNPLVKHIMKGFEASLAKFVTQAAPKAIHEVGCGEGYWVLHWNAQGIKAKGCDFSAQVIDLARENAVAQGVEPSLFEQRSIYDLQAERDSADLVVCCEVLEHLENPHAGLKALQHIVEQYLIISVPREPLWRVLNMLRRKYLSEWGNTPGHVQHWSKSNFVHLVEQYFDVVEVSSPLPWTMLLCRSAKEKAQ